MNKNRSENMVTGEVSETNLDAALIVKVNSVPAHGHTVSQITDAGDSAGLDVGTTAGTVAAGDHAHTGVYLSPDGSGSNLSDIASVQQVNHRLAPSPGRPNPTVAAATVEPLWLSSDGATLFGKTTTQLKKSADDGQTWTNVGSAFPTSVKGVRQLANGQLLVSVEKNTGVPGSLWLSSGYPSAPVFTKVLDAATDGGSFTNAWSLSADGGIVVASEYGTYAEAVHVYLSTDSGATWTTVFDLGAVAGAHVHGCAYDPYWKRIWVATGDSDNQSIRYSDDLGQNWTVLSSGWTTDKMVSILPMRDAVLFTSDDPTNGVRRIWRTHKAGPHRMETALNLEPVSGGLTAIGQLPYWRGPGYPALLPFGRAASSTGPGRIVATMTGADLFEIFTDDTTYNTADDGPRTALGPTASNKIVGALYRSGASYLMTMDAPVWVTDETPPPSGRTLSRYLTWPTTANHGVRSDGMGSVYATTGLDVRFYGAADDWTPAATSALVAKNQGTDGQRGFYFYLRTDGKVQLAWYPLGTSASIKSGTSTVTPTGLIDGQPAHLRATLQFDNGSGNYEVKFYQSADGATWSQIGTTVTGTGTTSIYANANEYTVGGHGTLGTTERFFGKIYSGSVRDFSGTVLVNPDFREAQWPINAYSSGSNTIDRKDGAGNTWRLIGSAVINAAIAFSAPDGTYESAPSFPSFTLTALPVYADNAAALAGGLTANQVYRTSTGVLMVTY